MINFFKKRHSLKTQCLLYYIGIGSAWTITSILHFFDGPIAIILRANMSSIALIVTLLYVALKYESHDEMSREHMREAKSEALTILSIIFLLSATVYQTTWTFTRINLLQYIPLEFWPWFTVGLSYLLPGIIFLRKEMNSEVYEEETF